MHRRHFVRLSAAALGATAALGRSATARADTYFPAEGAAGPATVVGFVDEPQVGSGIPSGGFFPVRGWVLDTQAQGWTAVNSVEVYDGRAEQGGRLLGSGTANLPRPDVAAAMGYPYWVGSGFSVGVNADDLPWGQRVLYVYAVTPDRGRWVLSVPVSKRGDSPTSGDRFPADPLIRVFDPLPRETLREGPRLMRGIALDRNATGALGAGVDRVEVYTGPRDQGGRLLGQGQLGKQYGEAAFEFGDGRFDQAGWDLVWDPRTLGSGERELFVYARRTASSVWSLLRVPVTIQA